MKLSRSAVSFLALLAGAPWCAHTQSGLSAQVVVIDPGHGGEDPGATGPAGTREKDVALAVALALAAELARYPELEVHLTRETDVLVPLWERGRRATALKGDGPGIFISLHANAFPAPADARGFETFFLSEARTDDERRVAANENASLAIGPGQPGDSPGAGLDFILKELSNLGHQSWSALLAELVQERMEPVHPGPDRGVKQGPFAVITNAMMPAVLVELGFITHRDEERMLARPDFQQATASALADAVLAFFRRYPPSRSVARGGPLVRAPLGAMALRAGEGCMGEGAWDGFGRLTVPPSSLDAGRELPCRR